MSRTTANAATARLPAQNLAAAKHPATAPTKAPSRTPSKPAIRPLLEPASERVAQSAEEPHAHKVPAVHRACAALWLLARHPEGLPLSRVARELGIIPSTCLHILRELARSRLTIYDTNTKLYRLGSGILTLGRELLQQNTFVQIAQPQLNQLSREFDVGASAQERDGDDDLLVVAAASVLPGDKVTPGARTPLLTSATGRLLAAFNDFSEAELKRRFARARWQNAPELSVWLRDVESARTHGVATDDGRFRRGITAIAAPVFNADGSVHRAISITVISAQIDDRRRKTLSQAVRAAATAITQALH